MASVGQSTGEQIAEFVGQSYCAGAGWRRMGNAMEEQGEVVLPVSLYGLSIYSDGSMKLCSLTVSPKHASEDATGAMKDLLVIFREDVF